MLEDTLVQSAPLQGGVSSAGASVLIFLLGGGLNT